MSNYNNLLDINSILNEYSYEVQEGISEVAKEIAKEGQKKLKQNSPKNTGEYAKGWRTKTENGRGYVKCTIYNSKKPQLTHLLEYGHKLNRNGKEIGYVGAKKHIEPVEKICNSDFEESVIKIIKNGGK